MGRGIIQDVSAKIVGQFADNLAAMLSGPPAGEAPPAEAAAPAGEAAAPPREPAAAPPAPESAELSALDLAGSVVAGRLRDPRALGGVLLLAVVLGFLLGRRRR